MVWLGTYTRLTLSETSLQCYLLAHGLTLQLGHYLAVGHAIDTAVGQTAAHGYDWWWMHCSCEMLSARIVWHASQVSDQTAALFMGVLG